MRPLPERVKRLAFTVNGEPRAIEVAARRTLAEALREDLGLTGTKVGCNRAECGSCTVVLDGRGVFACTVLAVEAAGRHITTVEGLAGAEGGRIHVKGAEARGMSFAEACALITGDEFRATGSRAPNPDGVIFRGFGAQAAEVEVDVETGELRVVRLVSSHDIGRAINPKLVESQQFGGAVMGLGYSLYEEAELDKKTGILLNADLHQYRVPTSLETPPIEAKNVEGEDAFYPYSAKPMGEAPLVGVMPAIRNALRHALGFGIDALPLTAARILDAIAATRRGDAR